MLFRVFTDILFSAIIYKLYNVGVAIGIGLFHIDFWFTRLTFGVIGVSFALLLFSWAKNVLFYFLKCCDIYLATDNKCSSAAKLFFGVSSRFGSIVVIPIFNRIIRSSIKELSTAVISVATNVEGTDSIAQLVSIDQSLLKRIVKCGKAVAAKTFDCADECILAYCFRNKEKKLPDAALEAMFYFVKSLDRLLPRMFTVSMMIVAARVVFYIASVVLITNLFDSITIDTIIMWYLMIKAVSFTIEDSIFEPIMLQAVVKEFIRCCDKDDISEIASDELFSYMPSLEDVTKMIFIRNRENA
ncbi:hypothetical protein AALB53_08580 [Lachnospiraceae bacterium 47-T17]